MKIEVSNINTKDYYDSAYSTYGFQAQRRYPNEEFMRFIGKNYGSLDKRQKNKIKFLELGCGAGANLWPLAVEGFDVHGLDISDEGIKLAERMLEQWGTKGTLVQGSMDTIPYPDNTFDIVADVFSSYCLNETEFKNYLLEVKRVLKPGGLYFSYHPSKNSMAYINHPPAVKIDNSTLSGILRETSPFKCNNHNCRFIYPDEYKSLLGDIGLKTVDLEVISRTYNQMTEYFEFVTITAKK